MSRHNPHRPNVDRLLSAAEEWGRRCLLQKGSVFGEEQLWTAPNIDEVHRAFVDHPIETNERFMDKLRQQFHGTSPSVVRLLAEIYWVLNLFPSNMGGELKRNQVREIWSWGGSALPPDHLLLDAGILEGVGSGGPGFLAHRWRELRFLMNLVKEWVRLPEAEQKDRFSDPWRFTSWVETIPDEGFRQLRHILPFLLFPDTFERIASPRDIRLILEKVGGMDRIEVKRMTKMAQDRKLLELRQRLEVESGGPIDFYEPEFRERWNPAPAIGKFTPAAAEAMLAASLTVTKTTKYIAAFETPAGRPIALDRNATSIDVWIQPPPPEVTGVTIKRAYEANQTRNSNLPTGLKTGQAVVLVSVADAEAMEGLIDVIVGGADLPFNEAEFQRLVETFKHHLPGFTSFSEKKGQYFSDERGYKDEFFTVFKAMASPALERAIDSLESAQESLAAVRGALIKPLASSINVPQNMIGWRGSDHLRKLEGDTALRAARALGRLWTGEAAPDALLGTFGPEYGALLETHGEPGAKGIVRSLGSLLLAIRRPHEAIFIRNEMWFNCYFKLVGGTVFHNQAVTAEEYSRALALARTLFDRLGQLGWQPQDLWDVHNFLWVATSYGDPEAEGDTRSEVVETGKPEIDPNDLELIISLLGDAGLRFDRNLVVRYHLGLRVRNFVILAGDSGTGKTKLAETYARIVGAEIHVEPVAPNWTSNEDLLGFRSPIDDAYRHTATSRFLERAAAEFTAATAAGRPARPYHLILDEMNLARVEHYFARLLSAMERRNADRAFQLELEPNRKLQLGPNLFVIGTVNVDETTHAFADKVYDRAQLIEVEASPELISEALKDAAYSELLMELWNSARRVAPFAFRTIEDVHFYVLAGKAAGLGWRDAIDHQIRQKILPKAKGADPRIAEFLDTCIHLAEVYELPLTRAKADMMREQYRAHGYSSFF